jgi:hypothetical protein
LNGADRFLNELLLGARIALSMSGAFSRVLAARYRRSIETMPLIVASPADQAAQPASGKQMR